MVRPEMLKLEDLKVGMRVYGSQLFGIYNTFIYLSDYHYDDEVHDLVGTIAYFGDLSIQEAGFKIGEVFPIFTTQENEGLEDYYE